MATDIRTYSANGELVAERRKQIIDRTTALLCRQGYDRTSIRQIAKACDMSMGNLYNYVGSKEEILYLIVDSAMSWALENLEACRDQIVKLASPLEALVEVTRRYYEMMDQIQDRVVFLYQEGKNIDKARLQRIQDNNLRMVDIFEELLRKCVDAGSLKPMENPRLLALDMAEFGHMWATKRWALRRYVTLDQYIQHQLNIVLGGLLSENSAVLRAVIDRTIARGRVAGAS